MERYSVVGAGQCRATVRAPGLETVLVFFITKCLVQIGGNI